MRLFIAIDFNELKDYFIGLQNLLPKNAKLSYTKTFHLTLKFLGEVEPNNVDVILGILKDIKFNVFPVFLDSMGVFPAENYIRIVWVGLKPEDKIIEFQKNIDQSLSKFFKKEKDFKAHITLARVKEPQDKKEFVKQLKTINVENKSIQIKNFKLKISILTQNGPIYENLAVF